MARIRVHSLCMRPLAECDCSDDEPEPGAEDSTEDEDLPGGV